MNTTDKLRLKRIITLTHTKTLQFQKIFITQYTNLMRLIISFLHPKKDPKNGLFYSTSKTSILLSSWKYFLFVSMLHAKLHSPNQPALLVALKHLIPILLQWLYRHYTINKTCIYSISYTVSCTVLCCFLFSSSCEKYSAKVMPCSCGFSCCLSITFGRTISGISFFILIGLFTSLRTGILFIIT